MQKEKRYFYAPGRINIIGEHTDYNGGYVLPCAVNMGTTAAISRRNDNIISLASRNFDLSIEIAIDNIKFDPAHDWANYPKGIVKLIQEKGHNIGGFDMVFSGNLPHGAGLSSSASIEIATAFALNAVFNLGMNKTELALLAQDCENSFIGVNCGIMDQFVIAMGEKNKAVFLKCDENLQYELVPFDLEDCIIMIINTNKRRTLADSKYNQRRGECNEAVEILRKLSEENDIKNLSEIDEETLIHKLNFFENETAVKRAWHVVSENQRVLEAVEALKCRDLGWLGELMNSSYVSLRYNYEVTGKELDCIIEEAMKIFPGTPLGAKITGAGFGGCAIALLKKADADNFKTVVGKKYKEIIGYAPSFYVVETDDGVREIFDNIPVM
ncbi:MAG: galactokinase [Defluviitaleaceae bacterium]|nr:galactokinase [Defluviitaleaceae bacterium]